MLRVWGVRPGVNQPGEKDKEIMGCDIHLYVERQDETGRWIAVDEWTRDAEDDNRLSLKDWQDGFYTGRNYGLFAILADVRNGQGFAGIKTGDGFNPIEPPRGLPVDCSPEVREYSEQWGVDGHSHSWFTVKELMAYDWTQVSQLCGVVDAKTFEHWDRCKGFEPRPREYSGDVFGGSVRKVTNDQMRLLIKQGANTDNTYTRVEWAEPYHQVAGRFLSDTLPRLWRVGPADKVRIVFWFDN